MLEAARDLGSLARLALVIDMLRRTNGMADRDPQSIVLLDDWLAIGHSSDRVGSLN